MIPEKDPIQKPPSFLPSQRKKEDEDRGGTAALFSRVHETIDEMSPVGKRARKDSLGLDRLWNLKPNELTMVLAGLSVLVAAPLIEFVLSRSGDQAAMRSEFDNPGSFLPEQEGAKEEGILRMAAGGLPGQAGPVIKRLDFPDLTKYIETGDMDIAKAGPSLLEPPAGGSKKKEKPESSASNWEEALTMAAKSSVTQATRSVGLPRRGAQTVGKLSSALSGLQGLSNLSAGSGASKSVSLSAPSSQGLTGTPQRSESLTRVQSLPDFHGGGARGPATHGPTGSGFFNSAPNSFGRPPSISTPETVSIPSGAGAGATQSPGSRPSEGDSSKSPGAAGPKDSKAIQSVKSLGQEMQEYNAKKSADLKYDIQKYNAIDRPKMILQQELQTAGQLANTALQGIFDLLKSKNQQQNQQNQQQQRQQQQNQPQNQNQPTVAALQETQRRLQRLSVQLAATLGAQMQAAQKLYDGLDAESKEGEKGKQLKAALDAAQRALDSGDAEQIRRATDDLNKAKNNFPATPPDHQADL